MKMTINEALGTLNKAGLIAEKMDRSTITEDEFHNSSTPKKKLKEYMEDWLGVIGLQFNTITGASFRKASYVIDWNKSEWFMRADVLINDEYKTKITIGFNDKMPRYATININDREIWVHFEVGIPFGKKIGLEYNELLKPLRFKKNHPILSKIGDVLTKEW